MMLFHQKSYVEYVVDSLDLRLGTLIQSIKGPYGDAIRNIARKEILAKRLISMRKI